jgi:hypothetical protein
MLCRACTALQLTIRADKALVSERSGASDWSQKQHASRAVHAPTVARRTLSCRKAAMRAIFVRAPDFFGV